LNHVVAPSKIGFALSKMHHSIEISKKLIELINQRNIENITKLNHIDIFMFTKFLQSPRVNLACKDSNHKYLNLEMLWQIVVGELTKNHVKSFDQKNLSVICKTLSELKQPIPGFWKAADDRFKKIEHEFDLRNFSFIVYAFVNSGLLDELSFLRLTRKSIIRNFEDINWKDLPMILSVAEKLDFSQHLSSKEYLQFREIISDSIESLIAGACKEPQSIPF
jgi:hypothetical protein